MNNKIIYLYDFAIDHTNRGCQALTYGSISFVQQKIRNADEYDLIVPAYCFKRRPDEIHQVAVGNKSLAIKRRYYWLPDIFLASLLYKISGGKIAFSVFGKDLKRVEYVTNISGGDGFSDIYSKKTFLILLWPSILAVFLRKRLVILPQTIGPFYNKTIRRIAHYVIRGAEQVYVRDLVYAEEMKKLKVDFEQTYDVSYFMAPKAIDCDLIPGSVGINVSGLAYYNRYRNLSGKFENYQYLIPAIIRGFQEVNVPVYLVPHAYRFGTPETDSDDLQASKDIYEALSDKTGVRILDLDMTAAEVKYVISHFDFFIGTRMHANFAAIYTRTPVFGLAYSYKFKGSFDLYGLRDQYASVVEISAEDIKNIVAQIACAYEQRKFLRIIS